MKTVNLIQGSPEWHAHRAQHFNASDAPAMMGCSSYKTRTQLLDELASGIVPEVDAATQRRFDDGHRYEALARPLAAQIIGETLSPVVGTNGKLSASFDGLTFMNCQGFEHKSLNDRLRAAMVEGCTGADLPLEYQVQMEQQCTVCEDLDRILFMASSWDRDGQLLEERHCWYTPNLELRAQIVAGWAQFEADLKAHVVSAKAAPIVVEPTRELPVVSVQITGALQVTHDLDLWETRLRTFLDKELMREPQSDADFVVLDHQIKAMKRAEEQLDGLDEKIAAQVGPLDTIKRLKDTLAKLTRDNRLAAEKILKNRKEQIRSEAVQAARNELAQHVADLNRRLGRVLMPTIAEDFAGVIKGLKSLDSLKDRIATEMARCKITANALADRIQLNLTTLGDEAHLFAHDLAGCVGQAPEIFSALLHQRRTELAARVAAEAEKQRLAAEAAAHAPTPSAPAAAAPLARSGAALAPTTPAPSPVAPPTHAGLTGSGILRDQIDDELQRMTTAQLQQVLDYCRALAVRKAA